MNTGDSLKIFCRKFRGQRVNVHFPAFVWTLALMFVVLTNGNQTFTRLMVFDGYSLTGFSITIYNNIIIIGITFIPKR